MPLPWPFSHPRRPSGFQPLANPSNDSELATSPSTTTTPSPRFLKDEDYHRKFPGPTCSITLLLIPLACFMMVVSGYTGFRLGRGDWGRLDKTCAAYTSQFSPVLHDIAITYTSHPFNGSFYHPTPYRLPASPPVDAAWADLGLDSTVAIIPFTDGLRAGLTPAHVQRNAKYGGGFIVNVEGMHHLHCLNLLRQGLWFNVEYYRGLGMGAFKNEEPILRMHITHCLDTIRQVLMCNADTGVLGQVWYNQSHPKAFPDFNTQHRCKNFDAIRDWAVTRQIDQSKLPKDFLAPPAPGVVLPEIP